MGNAAWWIATTVAVLAALDTILFVEGLSTGAVLLLGTLVNILIAGGGAAMVLWTRRGAAVNAMLEERVAARTAEFRASEARLRAFIQVAHDAVIVIDGQGLIQEFNPAAERMFGYPATELIGGTVNRLMPDLVAAKHDQYLQQKHPTGFQLMGRGREIIGRRADGSEFPIEVTVGTHRIEGTTYHVGLLRDITRQREKEQRLTRLATTDSLTGLLNRRAFLEAGERMMADRGHKPLTVLMLDADRFKSVNDTHGHAVGDEVLKRLASIVATSARADDAVGRLGGEEFAVLLHNTGVEGGTNLADRMLHAVRTAQIELAGDQTVNFTVSIGIASTATAHDLSSLLHQADQALYAAKNSGRDRLVAVTEETVKTLSPPG
ncbi:Putative diguanylate cyclase (GGDEF domain) with PAS/PAC sensor domain (fragment) [Magnetospirillum sp. LM-5]|uniref:GGDEF domain-containing protein n=1 Tax=Magnetospirillum sp. LM-5 TaxID=2681466 RepID=UPI00137FC64F